MTQYLYPQNLKATANLWLWGLRDSMYCCAIVSSGIGTASLFHSGGGDTLLRISDNPHG